MAELDVQPKKSTPWGFWLLIVLIVLALLFFLVRGCNHTEPGITDAADTTVSTQVAATVPGDADIDFNAPQTSYEEIADRGIVVRSNENYTIYSLGENILFATDQSTIQNSAEKQLKQVAASLEKRFKGASIAVYGNTDNTGSAGHNKELGQERAEAVKSWLIKNAEIPEDRIAVHSKGQSDPVASNETAEGRQQNRSVEIVATAQK